MADFPVHPDEVTPDWLSDRLTRAGLLSGGPVCSVRWEAIGTGQVGDSARFHLEYGEGGDGPPTLAGKFPAADATSRQTAAMFGLYAKEVGFYREIAPALDMRVPAVIAAEMADDPGEFVLLFEDLGPAQGGDQIAGCTIAQARQGVAQAAAIHAPSWKNTTLTDIDWLQTDPAVTGQVRALYPQAQAIFRERYAGMLEPELMAICEELLEAEEAWFTRSPATRCIIHGDFRLDNMLFQVRGGQEPIAILDWQTVAAGSALTDIGYFLGCGIGDDLRRKHEDELIALYLDEMAKRGVALKREEIWQDYRIGALHGVSTAVFSAAFVERTPRGDENFLSMARGSCALALAHDSIGALTGRS